MRARVLELLAAAALLALFIGLYLWDCAHWRC